jgi:hypothetical protein
MVVVWRGGCSSAGRAPPCGGGCRGFKSRHSPQVNEPLACENAGRGFVRSPLAPSLRVVGGCWRRLALLDLTSEEHLDLDNLSIADRDEFGVAMTCSSLQLVLVQDEDTFFVCAHEFQDLLGVEPVRGGETVFEVCRLVDVIQILPKLSRLPASLSPRWPSKSPPAGGNRFGSATVFETLT